MEHEKYISGWALSVMPTVWDDVVENMTGIHREYIECVVTKLHEPTCPNKSTYIEGKTIGDILQVFCLEFKDF